MATETVTQTEALQRARSSNSTANFSAIYAGFTAKGIPCGDITPRVNVLTFNAWKALGRVVRKGEHGVRITTWVAMTKIDSAAGAPPASFRRPKTTAVFHVSQTDAVPA
jgi:antirestriction protein ArdC